MAIRWRRSCKGLVLFAGLFCACVTVGQTQRPAAGLPSFEVASIRLVSGDGNESSVSPMGQGRFTATNVSINALIALAYDMEADQLMETPKWGESQLYSIDAKPEGDIALTYAQLKPRLQQLLAQRFQLVVHHESREIKGYALVVAKGGAKLKKSSLPPSEVGSIYVNGLICSSVSMQNFAAMLKYSVGRTVVDKTGITGSYSIDLKFAPQGVEDSELPSIITAVEEQLGLKLQPESVPTDILVIDHL